MTHRGTSAQTGRHLTRPAAALAGLVMSACMLAACGGSSGATPPPPGTAAPTPATPPSADPSATASPAAPTPTQVPSPTPEPTPVVFDSVAYGYRARFPAGMLPIAPIEAQRRWDGQARIDSTGPYTDRFNLPGSKLLFVYGASTSLELPDYAVDGQLRKHDWHGCPEAPESTVETTFDGVPAQLYSFTCGGLRVLSLYTVRDGYGVVFNQLAPPGNEAADEAELLELLSGWTWLD